MTEAASAIDAPPTEKTGVKALFGDFLNLASSHIILILLGIVSSVLSTRILGKEGYGLVSLFGMVAGMMFLLTANWTMAAVLRFGREEYDQRGRLNHTFWARNVIIVPCLMGGFALAYLFRKEISDYVAMPRWTVWLMMGSVLLVEAQTYAEVILQASHRIKFFALTRTFRSILSIVGLALIFWGLFKQTYLTVIIMGLCTGAVSTFFLALLFIPGRKLFPFETDRRMLNEVFRFSYPVIIGNTAAYVVSWVDVVFIKYYYAIGDVGRYQLAYNIFGLCDGIFGMVNVLMAPILISFVAVKREDFIIRYGTRQVPQGILVWAVLVGVGMTLSPLLFEILYGKEFLISALYFQLLACGLAFSSFLYLYSGVISAHKLMKLGMMTSVMRAIVNVIGNVLLVPGFGPVGAAWASTAAVGVAALFYLLICQTRLKVRLLWQMVLAMPVFLSLMVNCLVSGWVSPVLAIGVTLSGGFVLAKVFHVFRSEDLSVLDYVQMPFALKRAIAGVYSLVECRTPEKR